MSQDGVPVTYLALTRLGRRALEDYTAALRDLLAVSGTGTSNVNGTNSEERPS